MCGSQIAFSNRSIEKVNSLMGHGCRLTREKQKRFMFAAHGPAGVAVAKQ